MVKEPLTNSFRCSLDLSTLEPETTHELWLDLEDGAGKIFLLVTISGKSEGSDLTDQNGSKLTEELTESYSLRSSVISGNFFDVGHLEVKVFCAKGLYAADLVTILVSTMVRTPTCHCEVVGSNSAGCGPVFFFSPFQLSFFLTWSVHNQVPQLWAVKTKMDAQQRRLVRNRLNELRLGQKGWKFCQAR